jgi:hypothetical protein
MTHDIPEVACTERIPIAKKIKSFEKVRLPLAVLAYQKDLFAGHIDILVLEIPEISEPDILELHI